MKKLIGLFALVAVVSLVGCGAGNGSVDQSNKDEQKKEEQKAARPDGTYTVTSYVCSDGTTEPLTTYKTIAFSIQNEELSVGYEFDDARSNENFSETYTLEGSFNGSTYQATGVKVFHSKLSDLNTNKLTSESHDINDGAFLADISTLAGTFSITAPDTLSISVPNDAIFCGGSTGTITAKK